MDDKTLAGLRLFRETEMIEVMHLSLGEQEYMLPLIYHLEGEGYVHCLYSNDKEPPIQCELTAKGLAKRAEIQKDPE